jgi:hypothetical protein
MLSGDVDPNGDPNIEAQITRNLFVSMPLPGPTVSFHQPLVGSETELVT